MGLTEKAYFGLEEIEERWGLPRRDLVYLIENGILKVSVRVWSLPVERGCYEDAAEGPFPMPLERRPISGLLDLTPVVAHRLLRDGHGTVENFAAPEGEYLWIMEPVNTIRVRVEDLVVRREERDRVEREHPIGTRAGAGGKPAFEHRDDYSEVHIQDRTFHLGACQAKVVRALHEAAKSRIPWRHGKEVLGEAGSSCSRMADLFKTQKNWRSLILSDRKGRYRLNLPMP
ncbi:MAG: hypothetical protein FJ311_04975 [Rhodospirillales bacterium]|nr:hypothetical protein [Rhodospirillales bacterium]